MTPKQVVLDAHRRQHFNHFVGMASPHFGVTVNVDITDFLGVARTAGVRFTPALVYLITRAAVAVPSFRWRARSAGAAGWEVVEHATLRPSWAVPTAVSSAFSFCTVAYDADPVAFHRAAEETAERMRTTPSFSDEPGADDYLFLSAFPWASFTSVTHAMPGGPAGDSVPRIVWGKYFRQGDRTLMPLAVQAHHALVDGSEIGEYYRQLRLLLGRSEQIFEKLINS